MKNAIIIIGLVLTNSLAFGQGALGEVIGELVEKKSGDPAYGAVAFIEEEGKKYQARIDFDGRFRISAIPAGKHLVRFTYKGDTMAKVYQADVPMEGFYPLGKIEYVSSTQEVDIMYVIVDRDRLRLIDGNLPVKTITSEDLKNSPSKNDIRGLITGSSSDVRMTNDGELVFRGARKGDMLYLMDGIKTASIGTVPSSAIGRMMIYSGGLPAKYGDTMGGVVIMETKSYFDLYREYDVRQKREKIKEQKEKQSQP